MRYFSAVIGIAWIAFCFYLLSFLVNDVVIPFFRYLARKWGSKKE